VSNDEIEAELTRQGMSPTEVVMLPFDMDLTTEKATGTVVMF
jgi:hypothetical protein